MKHVIAIYKATFGEVYVTTVRKGDVKTSIFHQYARPFGTKEEAETYATHAGIQGFRVVFFKE